MQNFQSNRLFETVSKALFSGGQLFLLNPEILLLSLFRVLFGPEFVGPNLGVVVTLHCIYATVCQPLQLR